MLKIVNAQFIISAASKEQFVKTDKPVIAVCGKSNVGKSSFINKLAGRNKLAKVSKDPGRTRLINYFDLGSFILADLPGYGYAKVSKAEKARWAKLLDEFFEEGKITHVLALCDVRHPPTADDIDMVNYLYYHTIPSTIIATKADKLSKAQIARSVQVIANAYKCGTADIFVTSSQTGQGFDKVSERIENAILNNR